MQIDVISSQTMEAPVTKKKRPKALMVRFSESLREKIASEAANQDRSMNYIVLKIVEAHFNGKRP